MRDVFNLLFFWNGLLFFILLLFLLLICLIFLKSRGIISHNEVRVSFLQFFDNIWWNVQELAFCFLYFFLLFNNFHNIFFCFALGSRSFQKIQVQQIKLETVCIFLWWWLWDYVAPLSELICYLRTDGIWIHELSLKVYLCFVLLDEFLHNLAIKTIIHVLAPKKSRNRCQCLHDWPSSSPWTPTRHSFFIICFPSDIAVFVLLCP